MTATKTRVELQPEVALNYVIRSLKFIIDVEELNDFGKYRDQDGHYHLILKSDKLDKEQLHQVYNYTYLTGTTCHKRSKKYWAKPEATMVVNVNGVNCMVDSVTVASIIQKKCYGLRDMMLMSYVIAWLDGDM
jgi:hypothetical protein